MHIHFPVVMLVALTRTKFCKVCLAVTKTDSDAHTHTHTALGAEYLPALLHRLRCVTPPAPYCALLRLIASIRAFPRDGPVARVCSACDCVCARVRQRA